MPIAAREFALALNALDVRPPFALAVSGGADSLALMLLVSEWARRTKSPRPLAVTVDHGLRPASAREANRVAAWAGTYDVPHRTLTWSGPKPTQNIQAAARRARYRLIGEHLRARGLDVLLTGHTRDDQAETFLLRLARGSGLDGLSGMAPVARFPAPGFQDLKLARPLLGFSHARLEATLRARKQEWLADPMNDDTRFARVQIRKLLPALAVVGITAERIAAASANLLRARAAVDKAVAALIVDVELSPWGYALVDPAAFHRASREVALRALADLLQGIGGAEYPPRFEHTEATLDWLVSRASSPKGRTLGGCRLLRRPDGRILLAREEALIAEENPVVALRLGEKLLWDRRFEIALSQAPAGSRFEVRRLGAKGLKALPPEAALPAVEPRRIAACAPALWAGARLIAFPLQSDRGGVAVSMSFVGVSRLGPG